LLRFDGEGRLEQNQVDEFPSDDTQGSCSTTLRFEGETLIVGYARPPSGDKANNRELVQERWTLGPGGPRRLLGPARVLAGDNWGFDAHWLPWAKGLWALSHHSLNGYYHYVSIPELNTPPVRVGYQGDGRFQQAVYDSQGCWHLVMAPHRSNGDPSPLVYVKYRPTGNPRNPVETLIRAPIDNSPDSHRPDFGLATLPDDRAVVLMCRPHPISDRELVLKTMNDNGKWQTEQVLDWQPIVFSNLLCESDGTLRFLYIQTEGVPRPRLMLATRRSGRWQVEIVGDFQAPGRLKFESAWLADDPRGGLVAVVKGGYLTKDGIEKHVLLWVFRSR
jgi:hypothetical protein